LSVRRLAPALGSVAVLVIASAGAGDPPQAGRWRELPGTPAPPIDAERIEQLESIGYLRGTREEASTGVSLHVPAKAYPGLNLYTSAHAPEAVLMDMEGRPLHTWRLPYQDAFGAAKSARPNAQWWRRIHLYPNGDLLAIFEGLGIVKIDKDSELLWSNPLQAHHDLEVQPSGDIYVLSREAKMVPRIQASAYILEDFISVLGPDGAEKQRVSLLEAFENSPFRDLIFEGKRKQGDLFHTNTVAVLDGRIATAAPAFAKERVLTSMNALGVLAVVDLPSRSIVWVRKTPPTGQHDPQVLANGNLLLFENREDSGHSQVVEIDPVDFEVRWSYGGSDEQPLYSKFLGAVQRLPNGNTLITESDAGRALEVTREGEIVWQFHNPGRGGDRDQYIATLPEVRRLPAEFGVDWSTESP